jgi:hypothetical protein
MTAGRYQKAGGILPVARTAGKLPKKESAKATQFLSQRAGCKPLGA